MADRRPFVREHHGDVADDPYEWLRDKDDPQVIAHLEAENAWTSALTEHLEPLVETLFGELKDRTQETDLSVPVYARHHGPEGDSAWWYYTRTEEGAEYARYCRAPATDRSAPPSLDGSIEGETVYLDANVEAAGHEFFDLGALSVSPGGHLLAYSTDVTGAERYTLRIRDLRTGEDLPDTIADVAHGAAWAGDTHVFYSRCDEAWRPYVVLRHRLDTPGDDDTVVLTEPDERFWLGVDTSRDERWLVFGSGSKLTSEYRLLATDDPEGTPRVVAPRRQGVEYSVEPAGDRLLVVHNDGAEDFALAQAPLDATSHTQWETVLAAQSGVRLLEVDAYDSHVVVSLRRDGLSGLHVMPRDASGDVLPGSDVGFAEPLFTVGSPGSPEYDTPSIRIDYTSMLTPPSVYDYDLRSGRLSLLKQTAVLPSAAQGPYDPDAYVQERAWATAPDGARVPLSIVRRADVPLDGSAPALLYGYGSYEISMDPTFSISRLSFLDRGVVYAIAHVRGGGELGRHWYDEGKVLAKWNTFTDFAACADHLVQAGYTSPDRLAARGGSAGGLLMGVVANTWPEKFRAVHAQVPFVDALTTILDPDLPLTVTEWEEWGDPLHDPEVYRYMKSYTPYENVTDQDYPSILATTSLNDTRVYYVEPAKWVAALRATAGARAAAARRPVLLKTEMVAGHGGVSGRYASWREVAFANAWLLDQIVGRTG
ncbi:S9 family peptidase [Microlunatus sagamiharensis]|uniref:S9 family peptidase n=1 Tax=Microlunatus sagamiharensis TaxID=546874 RepID=UPI000AF81381|nr:S9 family peptidase [Microlunatus sagamiharensis]